jgi:hypothetical protein
MAPVAATRGTPVDQLSRDRGPRICHSERSQGATLAPHLPWRSVPGALQVQVRNLPSAARREIFRRCLLRMASRTLAVYMR